MKEIMAGKLIYTLFSVWRISRPMKTFLKLFTIILLLSTIHCINQSPFTSKKKEITIGDFVNFCMFNRSFETWNEVEDNRDGTVSLVTYSGIRNNPLCSLGEHPTRKVNFLVKKCIQGQVYRQTENDCKGAGSADNYWNAQKFQWCSNNDKSCVKTDSNGVEGIDYAISPAGITCNTDNATSYKFGIFPLSFFENYITYLSFFQDAPNSDFDYYWSVSNLGLTIQSPNYDQNSYNWRLQSSRFLLNSNLYVLCGKAGA